MNKLILLITVISVAESRLCFTVYLFVKTLFASAKGSSTDWPGWWRHIQADTSSFLRQSGTR